MDQDPNGQQIDDTAQRIFQDQDPLEENERAIRAIGDQPLEQQLEEEELKSGEERDVVQDIPGMDGNARVIPPADLIAEGMETAMRGAPGEGDEDDVRTAGDDEEAGGE